ncbi:MAG TPA: zinc-binding dehydrogenase [Candidatus Dormibacteraeota bacterium]|jgi:NADPH2:quinone reductase
MRAVILREFGPPDALVPVDVPDPVAGPGQALVDVRIANVTFVETQVRAGRPPHPSMAPALPVVPGNGVGGTVAAVGSGVDPGLVGARVISTTGGSGGYAERAAVDAGGLVAVPDGLGLAEAVTLLADGRTAMALVRAAAVQPGETVLVEAAGGGVGSLLVQLAAAAGARVVAAAGAPGKLDLARELGAAAAVDYTRPGWPDEAGAADVAFDGVGGAVGRAAFELLRPGGRLLVFGLASGAFTQVTDEEAAERRVTVTRGLRLTPDDMTALAAAALAEAAAGRLRPIVGQTFPLERAADAHAAIESRATLGRTLLVVA